MPDGTVMVLSQSGSVRLIRRRAVADSGAVARDRRVQRWERGCWASLDENFRANGFVYLYYTSCARRPELRQPHQPVHDDRRCHRSNSEIVLVDNISSHNRTTTAVIRDRWRRLYISVGVPASITATQPQRRCPRPQSAERQILRVVPSTGDPAPGNPISGPGTASCRLAIFLRRRRRHARAVRVGPAQPVPLRSIPTPVQRFLSTTSGSAREEVDEGGIGRNYGWPIREEPCHSLRIRRAQPATELHQSVDRLRAAGVRSSLRLRSSPTATGPPSTTVATWCGRGQRQHVAPTIQRVHRLRLAVRHRRRWDHTWRSSRPTTAALCYTLTGGAVRKISSTTTFVDPGPLAFIAVPRDTSPRQPPGTAGNKRACQHGIRSDGVDPAVTGGVGELAYVFPARLAT